MSRRVTIPVIHLSKGSVSTSMPLLVVTETLLLFASYCAATAYVERELSLDFVLINDGGLWRIGLVVAVIVLTFYFSDLYREVRVKSRIALLQQVSMGVGIAFVFQALLSYVYPRALLSQWVMIDGSVLVLVVTPVWRMLLAAAVFAMAGAQRTLFVGASGEIRDIMSQMVQRPELGLQPVGYIDSSETPLAAAETHGVPRVGRVEELLEVVEKFRPQRIIMADSHAGLSVEQLLRLQFSGVTVEEAAVRFENYFHRVSAHNHHPEKLLTSNGLGARLQEAPLRDISSWTLGLLLLVLTLPLMILIALPIKATSRGSVVLRQTRVGWGGSLFTLFRFRTRSLPEHAADTSRHTRIGRWMERWSVDKLPQLWNVVRGEMALVGPRPVRPEFASLLEERIPSYSQRYCIKPGITGWEQIHYPAEGFVQDTIVGLEYDLYYIKNAAVSLDAYIVLHAFRGLFRDASER